MLHADDEMLVTQWNALKPRADFARGYSVYFLREGWKLSRHLRADGTLLRHYIDIVETECDAAKNRYVFNDLLIDVIVTPDGCIRVVDVGEVPEAVRGGLITVDAAMKALELLDALLAVLYGEGLNALLARAEAYLPA